MAKIVSRFCIFRTNVPGDTIGINCHNMAASLDFVFFFFAGQPNHYFLFCMCFAFAILCSLLLCKTYGIAGPCFINDM